MHLSAGLVNGKSERGNSSDNYRRYFTTKRAPCCQCIIKGRPASESGSNLWRRRRSVLLH